MKKKFLMHVLALVLACSAVCFVGCNAKKDPVTSSDDGPIADGQHTHTYEPVAREESTCVTHGHEAYYVCDGCDTIFVKDGDIYEEADLDSLELPLGAHKFNGITLDTANVTTEYVAFEVFDESGLKVTKTCSVEGCAGVKVPDLDVEIAYPVEGATCLTAAMDHVIVKVGDYSANLNVTVSKKVIALPEIAGKPATGSVQVADVAASDYYEVTTNNGGETAGLYDVVLTVKDTVNCTFKVDGVESATATVKFEILKGANTITMPASIAPVMCHNEPEVAATALENPEFTKLYSDTADGEFYPITSFGDGLSAGTWYVKVKAAETASFGETLSDAVSFNVAHKFGGYKKGENEDVPVCACGEEINGDSFKTLVTDTNYVLATAEGFATDMAKLTFGGASEFVSVDAITCGNLELGSVAAPNAVNVATLIGGAHGAKTFNIEVTDKDGYAHILTVPVVLVTEYINDWSTLLYKTQMHNGRQPEDCIFGAGEYYVLSDDITATGRTSGFTYNGAEYSVKDYYSWNYEQSSYDAMKGFSGTVDGAGHTIKNVDVGYCGIFASLKDGTIKNLTVSVDSFSKEGGVLALHVGGATIENVNIIINNSIDSTTWANSGAGIIFTQFAFKTNVKNVNIYAPGSKIKYAIAQGYYAGITQGENTYTNIKCYAASLETFTAANKTIETCEFIETVEDNNKIQSQYVESAKENVTLTLPAVFSDYTVSKVVINGVVVGNSETLATSTVLEAVGGKFGEFDCVITIVKDGHTMVLPCSVAVVSEVITSWAQLRYRVTYRSGVASDFGKGEYYVLGNDIIHVEGEASFNAGAATTYNGENVAAGSPAWGSGSLDIQSGEAGGWTVAGFAGTLDGAGHTIKGIDFVDTSLFGSLSGATIKNINLEGTMYEWGSWSIFSGSGDMDGTTIENVNITVAGELDYTKYDGNTEFRSKTGLFSGGQMSNCVIKNVVIKAEGIILKNAIAPGNSATVRSGVNCNTWSNVKVYLKDYYSVAVYDESTGKGNICWGINGEDSQNGLMIYTAVQEIELSGDTFELKLPTAITKLGYSVHRLRINKLDSMLITENTLGEDYHVMISGGIIFDAMDISKISVEQVKELIGENYGEYEIVYAVTNQDYFGVDWASNEKGITYASHGHVLRVKFTAPETNVEPDQGTEAPDAGTENPSGGDESAAAGTEE